jgi:hypothetical protein
MKKLAMAFALLVSSVALTAEGSVGQGQERDSAPRSPHADHTPYLGTWQTETGPPTFLALRLEIEGESRLSVTMGTYMTLRWRLLSEKGDEYTVELLDLQRGELLQRIELELRRQGKKERLIQRAPESEETIRLERVAGTRPAEGPAFVGIWSRRDLGLEAFHEFTADGWFWLTAPAKSSSSKYRVEDGKIVPSGSPEDVGFQEFRLEGEMLSALDSRGEQVEFFRPRVAAMRPERAAEVADEMLEAHAEGILQKELFSRVDGMGEISDIVWADLDSAAGYELGVASSRGAMLVDGNGKMIRTVRFSEPAGRAEIVDVESDGVCEYMDRGAGWSPVGLYDHEGHLLWHHEPELPNDMAAGDLDGDRVLDFVVAAGQPGAVRRLDHEGNLIWKDESNVVDDIHLLDYEGDGDLDIVYLKTGSGTLRWRDAEGELLSESRLDPGSAHLELYGPHAPGESVLLTTVATKDDKLEFRDYAGKVVRSVLLPVPQALAVYGVKATPVRFETEGPTFTAVAVWLRKPYSYDRGGLYLFDDSGDLLHQEMTEEGLYAVTVIPGGEQQFHRLLVGSVDVVWEYKLASR